MLSYLYYTRFSTPVKKPAAAEKKSARRAASPPGTPETVKKDARMSARGGGHRRKTDRISRFPVSVFAIRSRKVRMFPSLYPFSQALAM